MRIITVRSWQKHLAVHFFLLTCNIAESDSTFHGNKYVAHLCLDAQPFTMKLLLSCLIIALLIAVIYYPSVNKHVHTSIYCMIFKASEDNIK